MVPSWASPELVEMFVLHKDAVFAETSRMSPPRLLKRKVHGNHWRPDKMDGVVHGGAIILRRVRLVHRSSVAFRPGTSRVETN